MEDLWRLEEQFWTGDAHFYRRHLASSALMVFPQPVGVLDRQATAKSIESAERWKNLAFADRHFITPAYSTAILAYTVKPIGVAPILSTRLSLLLPYVSSSEGWQLALYQQTPID